MTTTDPGLDFWLQYVSSEGGIHERTGDSTLVLLPEMLQERHDQAEDMIVTADPDVAREDGALLLTAGHPLLSSAAESVLSEGDVGCLRLPQTSGRTPDADFLQMRARDQFVVDHGRVDVTGGPTPAVRTVLRVSSLVTFTMSADDHFQEQIESWVDVPSRLPLADDAGRELSRLLTEEQDAHDHLKPDIHHLVPALAAADEQTRRRAESRRNRLAGAIHRDHQAEIARTDEYYRQIAASLERRVSAAAADKVATLKARLEHTAAERGRRIAEIDEKYSSSFSYLPFRLHVVGVPALRVEADIRRGNRRHPVELDWLLALRHFAPMRCPTCGSTARLVMNKTGLACHGCQPPRRGAGDSRRRGL